MTDKNSHSISAETAQTEHRRAVFRQHLQQAITQAKDWPRKPNTSLKIPPKPHGWLLPILIDCETQCWGRWDHWTKVKLAGDLIDEPIPQIAFEQSNTSLARKMHENALNSITGAGDWRGWSGWENFNYYLDWLLYAFGHQGQTELPREPVAGAFSRLYQTFCLEAMLAWPQDLFGDLLADNAHGRRSGFYPTPHHVVEMMTKITFGADEDSRLKSFCDPCLGTGRMPLHASNYTYRLCGQDIDPTVIKAALVNGYCFAPWLVRPLFDDYATDSAALSDAMTEQAEGNAAVGAYLNETVHDDAQQYAFEPIKKRRKKSEPEVMQGLLFKHLDDQSR